MEKMNKTKGGNEKKKKRESVKKGEVSVRESAKEGQVRGEEKK
jgi:hypothetical protein